MTCLLKGLDLAYGHELVALKICTDSSFAETQIIRKLVPEDQYEPPVEEYVAAAQQRMKEKQTKQRRPFPVL